jgi:hypothetical protein
MSGSELACGNEVATDGEASTVQRMLNHIGEPTVPLRITPARGPLLWEEEDFGTIFLDFPKAPYLALHDTQRGLDRRLATVDISA